MDEYITIWVVYYASEVAATINIECVYECCCHFVATVAPCVAYVAGKSVHFLRNTMRSTLHMIVRLSVATTRNIMRIMCFTRVARTFHILYINACWMVILAHRAQASDRANGRKVGDVRRRRGLFRFRMSTMLNL